VHKVMGIRGREGDRREMVTRSLGRTYARMRTHAHTYHLVNDEGQGMAVDEETCEGISPEQRMPPQRGQGQVILR
jgi:hypothetical protein